MTLNQRRTRRKSPAGPQSNRQRSAARPSGAPDRDPTVVRLIALIGSPIALGTALLFYFGWVRTSVQARTLGLDVSVLGMSTQDYLLKSINVLFVPLVLLLLASIVFVWMHERLVTGAESDPRRVSALLSLARWLTRSWIVWMFLCVPMLAFPASRHFAIPLTLTLAVLCVLYAQFLQRRLPGGRPASTTMLGLILMVLSLVLFWDVERLARAMGQAFAQQIIRDPSRAAKVTVFSGKDLELHASGVSMTMLDREAAYRFRYDGLRLLQRSDGRYLLMNDRWDRASGRVIVLHDNDQIRLEFSAQTAAVDIEREAGAASVKSISLADAPTSPPYLPQADAQNRAARSADRAGQ